MLDTKFQERVKKLCQEERRLEVRSWFFGLGLFFLFLALVLTSAPVASPESWTSIISFFAIIGSFDRFAIGLATIGIFFIVLAVALPSKNSAS